MYRALFDKEIDEHEWEIISNAAELEKEKSDPKYINRIHRIFHPLAHAKELNYRRVSYALQTIQSPSNKKQEVIDELESQITDNMRRKENTLYTITKDLPINIRSLALQDRTYSIFVPGTYLFILIPGYPKIGITEIIPAYENLLLAKIHCNRLSQLIENPSYDHIMEYLEISKKSQDRLSKQISEEIPKMCNNPRYQHRINGNNILADI